MYVSLSQLQISTDERLERVELFTTSDRADLSLYCSDTWVPLRLFGASKFLSQNSSSPFHVLVLVTKLIITVADLEFQAITSSDSSTHLLPKS